METTNNSRVQLKEEFKKKKIPALFLGVFVSKILKEFPAKKLFFGEVMEEISSKLVEDFPTGLLGNIQLQGTIPEATSGTSPVEFPKKT